MSEKIKSKKTKVELSDNNIVFPLAISWDQCADFQKQTINYIKKKNKCFVYLAGDQKLIFRTKKSKNLFIFYPMRNPFKIKVFDKIINFINISVFKFHIKKLTNNRVDIVWLFNSELNHFFNLFRKTKIKIYDLVDFADLNDLSRTISSANLVFANSTILKKFANSVSNKKITLVPQGFDLKTYNNNPMVNVAPSKNLTITYIGSINFRFDFLLLHELIKNNQNYNFIFWGPIQYLNHNLDQIYAVEENINKLKQYKNVKFGLSDRKGTMGILKNSSVGIIPYNTMLDFNRNCFPMKLLEYFYMGLPVLSTTIEELNRYKNLIHISNEVEEWTKFLQQITQTGWPIKSAKLERKIAEAHSWSAKIKQIEKEINNLTLTNQN